MMWQTISGVPVFTAGNSSGRPPILFIHENRGLSPYMRAVIDELAAEGYEVWAPDLLHRLGGTSAAAGDSASTRDVSEDVHEADLVAVFDGLAHTPVVLGFCFGAEMGWRLVTRRTPVAAALLYGIGPTSVDRIGCPVLAVYAEDDPRVNDTLPDLCRMLASSDVDYRLASYPGTKHAFHDRDRPERFHPDAAAHVWAAVLESLGDA